MSVDAVSDQSLSAAAPADPAPRPPTATVLAVLVTRDPGPAFDAVMEALAAQDHARLEVLVVDVGDAPAAGRAAAVAPAASPLLERVGRVLPGSTGALLDGNPGFGAAVAAGLAARPVGMTPRFLLLLTDDVLLGGTAVRRMVEEAVEANAGIVGAKVLGSEGGRTLDLSLIHI